MSEAPESCKGCALAIDMKHNCKERNYLRDENRILLDWVPGPGCPFVRLDLLTERNTTLQTEIDEQNRIISENDIVVASKDAEIKKLRALTVKALDSAEQLFKNAILSKMVAEVSGEKPFDLEAAYAKLRQDIARQALEPEQH